MAFESAEDVALHLPRFIDSHNERLLHSALGYLSPNHFEEEQARKPVKAHAPAGVLIPKPGVDQSDGGESEACQPLLLQRVGVRDRARSSVYMSMIVPMACPTRSATASISRSPR